MMAKPILAIVRRELTKIKAEHVVLNERLEEHQSVISKQIETVNEYAHKNKELRKEISELKTDSAQRELSDLRTIRSLANVVLNAAIEMKELKSERETPK